MDSRLRVFLSYVSQDYHIVQELSQKLKENNFDVWVDREELLGGQPWREIIDEIIHNSDVVIICLSKNCNKEGYFQKEVKLSLEIEKEKPEDRVFIIPLKLEECNISKKLVDKQWINYFENDGFDNLLKSLSNITPNTPPINKKYDLITVPLNEKIKTDDFAYSPYSETAGCEIAVRLTPNKYPTVIKAVKFYITCDQEPWSDFKVNIYNANGLKPGKRLNISEIYGKDGNGDTWIELNIYEHKIIISEGDFFVSMVWLKAPGRYGEYAQFLGGRHNSDIPGRTCFKFDENGVWWLKNRINCMIQAVDILGNTIET